MGSDINFLVVIPKFDAILSRGLCAGLGTPTGQMCIEAALCAALALPHGDWPYCVSTAVRNYKIALNDAGWSSPQARASGLRNLGIAQIGSEGIVTRKEFNEKLQEKTIRILIPDLFRKVFHRNINCLEAATQCETHSSAIVGAVEVARSVEAAWAARAARARNARRAGDVSTAIRATQRAAMAAMAALYAETAMAAQAANAAQAAHVGTTDYFLLLSAKLALEVLVELKSPGARWITHAGQV